MPSWSPTTIATPMELARDGTLVTGAVRGRAARALSAAAERASALSNYPGAASYARAAIELVEEGSPLRPRLLFQLGTAEAAVAGGGRDELLEAATAFEEAGDIELAAEARVLVALGGYLVGREDELDEQLGRATALVADRPASRAKARVWASRARSSYLAGRFEEALRLGREALAMAEQLGADDIRAEALLYAGGARHELGDGAGIDDMLESLEVARSINSATHITRVCNNLSIQLRLEGRMDESRALAEEGLAVARRFGMEAHVQFALGALTFRDYDLGRWDAAVEAAEAFLAGPGGLAANQSSARSVLALISIARDDSDRALAEAERTVELAKAGMAPLPRITALAIKAFVLVALGALDDARKLTLELSALHRQSTGFAFGADAHPVWAWQKVGLLAHILEAAPATRRTPWLDAAECVLAGSWADAAAIYERSGSPMSTALARLNSGDDANVRAALEFFRSAGAPFYERQAEALLAATA